MMYPGSCALGVEPEGVYSFQKVCRDLRGMSELDWIGRPPFGYPCPMEAVSEPAYDVWVSLGCFPWRFTECIEEKPMSQMRDTKGASMTAHFHDKDVSKLFAPGMMEDITEIFEVLAREFPNSDAAGLTEILRARIECYKRELLQDWQELDDLWAAVGHALENNAPVGPVVEAFETKRGSPFVPRKKQ